MSSIMSGLLLIAAIAIMVASHVCWIESNHKLSSCSFFFFRSLRLFFNVVFCVCQIHFFSSTGFGSRVFFRFHIKVCMLWEYVCMCAYGGTYDLSYMARCTPYFVGFKSLGPYGSRAFL